MDMDVKFVYPQGLIKHSWRAYQRKAWALFSYAYPGFSLHGVLLWECTFFSQKVDDFFQSLCLSHERLNVKTEWEKCGS